MFQNTRDKLLMPPELREVMKKYISRSKNGTLGKCQGGDAMLEELNKQSKSWLKMSGIPSNNQWLEVFRNIDGLTEVDKVFFIRIINKIKCNIKTIRTNLITKY